MKGGSKSWRWKRSKKEVDANQVPGINTSHLVTILEGMSGENKQKEGWRPNPCKEHSKWYKKASACLLLQIQLKRIWRMWKSILMLELNIPAQSLFAFLRFSGNDSELTSHKPQA